MLQHTFSKVSLMWLFYLKIMLFSTIPIESWLRMRKMPSHMVYTFVCLRNKSNLDDFWPRETKTFSKTSSRIFCTVTSALMTSWNRKNILRKDEWTALMDLHKDDSIIITQTGKGNGAVIINKLAWLSPEKWKHYISDDSKFKELKTTQ